MKSETSRRPFVVRAAAFGLALSLTGTVLAACSKGSQGTEPQSRPASGEQAAQKVSGEVVLFKGPFHAKEVEFENQMIDSFQKKFPDVKVKFQQYDWPTIEEQITAAFAGGKVPDVMYIPGELYVKFAVKGGPLEDLGTYVTDSTWQKDREAILPQAWKWAQPPNGILAGVPYAAVAQSIYFVNLDLMQKAGVDPNTFNSSLDSVRAAAKKMTLGDTYGFSIRTGMKDVAFFDWLDYMYNAGGTMVTKDWKSSGLNTPEAAKALQTLMDIQVVDKSAPPAGKYPWAGLRDLFIAGKIGIHHDEETFTANLKEANVPFKWGVALLPPGPQGQTTWGNFGYLVIPKGSKNKAAAWELIKHWNSPESLQPYFEATSILTLRTDLAPKMFQGQPQMQKVQTEFLPKAVGGEWLLHPKNFELLSRVQPIMDRAYRGELSGAQALQEAQKQVEQVIR